MFVLGCKLNYSYKFRSKEDFIDSTWNKAKVYSDDVKCDLIRTVFVSAFPSLFLFPGEFHSQKNTYRKLKIPNGVISGKMMARPLLAPLKSHSTIPEPLDGAETQKMRSIVKSIWRQ